jgi:hypothetical protein
MSSVSVVKFYCHLSIFIACNSVKLSLHINQSKPTGDTPNMTAPRYSFAVQADTIDELYASVAAFLDRSAVSVTTYLQPPTGVHADPVNIHPHQDGTTSLAQGAQPVATTDDADGDDQPNAAPPAFDKAGIPWDERIHASTKGMNQDGTWKRRRNTADVTYNIVMAELQAKATAGQQPAAAPQVPASPVGIVDQGPVVIPAAAPVPAPPMAAPAAVAPAVPSAPAIPAAPAVPAAPAPVAAVAEPAPVAETAPAPGMSFTTFMPKIAQAMATGKFTAAQLDAWITTPAPDGWGMTNISQFQADPVKTEQFYGWLKSAGLVD